MDIRVYFHFKNGAIRFLKTYKQVPDVGTMVPFARWEFRQWLINYPDGRLKLKAVTRRAA